MVRRERYGARDPIDPAAARRAAGRRLWPLGLQIPADVPADAVDVVTAKPRPGGRYAIVILDRVDDIPQQSTPYCIHGRVSCAGGCGHWLWLGHESHRVVAAGDATPMCKPCAIATVPEQDRTPIDRIRDHQRADGPHE